MIWGGDLHNHNGIGYGKGTIGRSSAIARKTLDFYAFPPHGWWPDTPANDPKVTAAHERGFEAVGKEWETVRSFVREYYQPGRFVPLLAHEWHSSQWGDYCLLFPSDAGVLCHATTISELQDFCRKWQALMIPHHCAYPVGIRSTAWATINRNLSPVAEIFSEHGNSLEPQSAFGMYRHSMGGTQNSRTVLEQIRKGTLIGFVAGTDNHYGHPGSYGEGLTAIVADDLSRESVLQALAARHTYAVSGERMELNVLTGSGRIIGDIIPSSEELSLTAEIQGQGEIDYVELFHNGYSAGKTNGKVVRTIQPTRRGERQRAFLRLELGWSGMNDMQAAIWQIALNGTSGTAFRKATPYVSSGSQSTGYVDTVALESETRVVMQTHSSRTNSSPTALYLFEVEIGTEGAFTYEVRMEWQGETFLCRGILAFSDLAHDDVYITPSDSFSAPKIKFHRLLALSDAYMQVHWDATMLKSIRNDNPNGWAPRDSYFIKVVQKNGQCAWTSPIWQHAKESKTSD